MGVSPPVAENSNRYDRPVRSRAPPIRYGDARCHQTLGLQHSRVENKNLCTTVCANKRETKEGVAMVNWGRGQPIKVQDGQLATVTEALRVIPHLVSTLHTSVLHLSDICTKINMRHFAGRTSTPSNNLLDSGESTLHNNKTTTLSAPNSALHCQPTSNTRRVAYKDLEKIQPAKPELLESDDSEINDWDSDDSESGVDEAAMKLDKLCQHDDPTPLVSTHLVSAQTVSTPNVAATKPIHVVGSTDSGIPRVRAPSPIRVNKVKASHPTSNTEPTSTIHKERWLSNTTLAKIEAAIKLGRCTICELQANELRRTKIHVRQHFTLHMCKCKLFSPSRDTIYRHQRQGRCSIQHKYIYEVDKESYDKFCQYIGWTEPPKFGHCVPAKQGRRPTHPASTPNTKRVGTTLSTPIEPLKLRVGYRIPKKSHSTTNTKEEGEVISSEEDEPTPTVASKICRTKRARSESPATELRRAIKLLEDAEELEQLAREKREEAKEIRLRYDGRKRY